MYQTMNGWEATAQAGQWECAGFSNYKNQLYDTAAHDLGINRLRVELTSGSENPTDYFAQFRSGLITFPQYMQHAFEVVNDNNDPALINPNGFHFSAVDDVMDSVVLPLRQRLQARGEQLYINLNFVDGDSTLYRQSPAEYAEFMVAAFQHLQSRYGFVPDAVELVLEPDNTGSQAWTATQVGNAMVAAGDRLKSLGFTPDFIAPSNASMAGAVTYFDQLIQVPGASNYVRELSYHRYNSVSDASLLAIGSRAEQRGIRAAMLEHIGSDYNDLQKDLTLARNSAWQQFTLGFCGTNDIGGAYYKIDNTNPSSPVLIIGSRTKLLRQYFKFVRRGAVRIGATSKDATFSPLAFVNANGKYVVVVSASAGGQFSVGSLPAGTYGIKYTTGTQYDVDAADVTLGAGAALNTSIPASGVLTIYAK